MSHRNPATSAARKWARETDIVRTRHQPRPMPRRTATRQAIVAAHLKEI
jgi:hypothetical protein